MPKVFIYAKSKRFRQADKLPVACQ